MEADVPIRWRKIRVERVGNYGIRQTPHPDARTGLSPVGRSSPMRRGRRARPAGRRYRPRMMRWMRRPPDNNRPGWRRRHHDNGPGGRRRGHKTHRGCHDVRSGRRGADLHVQAAVAAGHIPRATKVEVAHAEAGCLSFGAQGSGAHEQYRGCTENDFVHIVDVLRFYLRERRLF